MERPREIQSDDARARWSQLLEEVNSGRSYVITERHRSIAVLVPVEQWQEAVGEKDVPDVHGLYRLVEEVNESNVRTETSLNKAFEELAETREFLLQAKTARVNDEASEERAREEGRRKMETLLAERANKQITDRR